MFLSLLSHLVNSYLSFKTQFGQSLLGEPALIVQAHGRLLLRDPQPSVPALLPHRSCHMVVMCLLGLFSGVHCLADIRFGNETPSSPSCVRPPPARPAFIWFLVGVGIKTSTPASPFSTVTELALPWFFRAPVFSWGKQRSDNSAPVTPWSILRDCFPSSLEDLVQDVEEVGWRRS